MPRNPWKQFLKDPYNIAILVIAALGVISILGHVAHGIYYWR